VAVEQSRALPGSETDRLEQVLGSLERWGASRDWVGPDPYEGLNSPVAQMAVGRRAKQAVTQAYKRSPWAPPWPLGAPARPNSKALALALSGYATAAGSRLQGASEFLERLPAQLWRLNLLEQEAGWGYPFDVQTRNVTYSSRTPNAIATSFVVEALCDLHELTGGAAAADLALSARPFLLSLRASDAGSGPYFAYVSAGAPLIHNANLLVCGALARLDKIEPDATARQAVEAAAETTIARQRSDGLWPYGELANYGWVDNFHTAYTLDGLKRVSDRFTIDGEALMRAVAAWKTAFIEPDGWARYYPNGHFPLETHCSASAIDLLTVLGDDRGLAVRIADGAVRELWLGEAERFAFRRTARGLNRREFVRWTNAPMFRALSRLMSGETPA
jgi:hypothetical protein